MAWAAAPGEITSWIRSAHYERGGPSSAASNSKRDRLTSGRPSWRLTARSFCRLLEMQRGATPERSPTRRRPSLNHLRALNPARSRASGQRRHHRTCHAGCPDLGYRPNSRAGTKTNKTFSDRHASSRSDRTHSSHPSSAAGEACGTGPITRSSSAPPTTTLTDVDAGLDDDPQPWWTG